MSANSASTRGLPDSRTTASVNSFREAIIRLRSPRSLAQRMGRDRAVANGEIQFFVVCTSCELRRKDFPLGGSLFVVLFGASRCCKRGKVVLTNKPRGSIAHGVFVERKRVVQHVTPDH